MYSFNCHSRLGFRLPLSFFGECGSLPRFVRPDFVVFVRVEPFPFLVSGTCPDVCRCSPDGILCSGGEVENSSLGGGYSMVDTKRAKMTDDRGCSSPFLYGEMLERIVFGVRFSRYVAVFMAYGQYEMCKLA